MRTHLSTDCLFCSLGSAAFTIWYILMLLPIRARNYKIEFKHKNINQTLPNNLSITCITVTNAFPLSLIHTTCTGLTYSEACIIGFKSSRKEDLLEGLDISDFLYIQVTKVHQVSVIALPQGNTVLLQKQKKSIIHHIALPQRSTVLQKQDTSLKHSLIMSHCELICERFILSINIHIILI